MTKSDEHIVLRYRSAKENDRKQRLIELADENHCSVQTIKDILLANDVPMDELPRGKGRPRKNKAEEITNIPVVEPTEKRLIEPPKPEIKLPEPKAEEVPLVKVEIKEPPTPTHPVPISEQMKIGPGMQNPKLEKIPITVLDVQYPFNDMLTNLNTQAEQLKNNINRDKELLDAMTHAYVAIKELDTLLKERER